MTLSDLTVRQAKAAEKTYSIPDTDGLGLVVARTGGKQRFGDVRRQADDAPRWLCQTHRRATVIDNDDFSVAASGEKQTNHADDTLAAGDVQDSP